MGDTGSMGLGGALAAFAIMTKTEVLLLLIGGIFLIEALSVILQVISFKWTRARIFLMAPLHHHFEMKAWSETGSWCASGSRRRSSAPAASSSTTAYFSSEFNRPRSRSEGARPRAGPLGRGGGARAGPARGAVLGVDRNEDARRGQASRAGVEVVLGADDDALLDGVELLVKSPGVPSEAPLAAAARERASRSGARSSSARLVANPILGVTGTNGKTTTTELLGAIFRAPRAAGRRRRERRPTALRARRRARRGRLVVCELSSFQLEDIETFRPRRRAPQPHARPPRPPRRPRRLPRREAPHLREPGRRGRRGRRPARLRRRSRARAPDRVRRSTTSCPPSRASRASTTARTPPPPRPPRAPPGSPTTPSPRPCARSRACPHRLELVREIDGVRFVNDSKATNPEAAERALRLSARHPAHPRGQPQGTRSSGSPRAPRRRSRQPT